MKKILFLFLLSCPLLAQTKDPDVLRTVEYYKDCLKKSSTPELISVHDALQVTRAFRLVVNYRLSRASPDIHVAALSDHYKQSVKDDDHLLEAIEHILLARVLRGDPIAQKWQPKRYK